MTHEGHPRRWTVLAVLCAALCAIVIDNTILSIAVPSIGRSLAADETDLQWISAAYALALSGLLLPLAVLGDRFGRKRLFLVGLAIFGAASAAAASVDSAGALVVCRGVMGVGGAAAMPATLAILGNVFSEAERPRAIAVWSGVAGFASAAGPLLGGVLLGHYWWGVVFVVNVPIVVVGLVVAVMVVPESRDPAAPPIDWGGAALWTGALIGLLFAIIEGPERGWTSALVVGPVLASVVLLVAFAARERRAPAPLLAPETARHPGMRAGAAIIAAMFFALFGSQFVLTQWFQGPRALGTVAAGLCFVPNALASVVGAMTNTAMVGRYGSARTIAAGVVLVAAGMLGTALAISLDSVVGAVVAFGVFGLGQGWTIPTGMELIMTSASAARAGSAAGVNETIVEAGGALGVAVLGSVLVAAGGFASPLLVGTGAFVLAAGVSLRVQRGRAATVARASFVDAPMGEGDA
jgi:MFS family permease